MYYYGYSGGYGNTGYNNYCCPSYGNYGYGNGGYGTKKRKFDSTTCQVLTK